MSPTASNSGDVRHSHARKALLGEFLLWTAVCTGFPLAPGPEADQASQPGNSGELRQSAKRVVTTRDERSLPAAMGS